MLILKSNTPLTLQRQNRLSLSAFDDMHKAFEEYKRIINKKPNIIIFPYLIKSNDEIKEWVQTYKASKCLDLSWAQLSKNVVDLSYCFWNSKAHKILISHWDLSVVDNIDYMFCNCKNLKTIDIQSWETSSIVSMYGLFYNCLKINDLDLSAWDIRSNVNIDNMFVGCESLTNIKLPDNINLR